MVSHNRKKRLKKYCLHQRALKAECQHFLIVLRIVQNQSPIGEGVNAKSA